MRDPDFGQLVFMPVADAPERSYWEAEWRFPPTDSKITVSLPGDQDGPFPESREFVLSRAREFERIMDLVRPHLDAVFRQWLGRPLPLDVWTELKLAGFDVDDPRTRPLAWDVSFETLGERWLGITLPFLDDRAQPAVVDT